MVRVPRLSKSRFQAGLQCVKYLWLYCYMPEAADEPSETLQAIFDQGHAVGELAREYFPGGVLVEEDHTRSTQALRTTEQLLGGDACCLYEAAIAYDNVFVRPDILFRLDEQNWALVEVKVSHPGKAGIPDRSWHPNPRPAWGQASGRKLPASSP